MKHFVVTLDFTGTSMDQEVSAAQAAFVHRLYNKTALVLAGPFDDGEGGMAVLRCDSLEQAEKLYRDSPVIRSGHATFKVREWKVLLGEI
ncbi:YciI family protein [Streptomyces chengbuensis]|uniref:YciI family protein n=1 Tax=Streptomyces TaxID=1883 RepID=UPI0025B43F7C|nr:YciI family protein [Streptomyces sp. HUAS CB01]WJY48387.1 YciI family protein [Streptomyces sp. HUAS CB01]